MSDMYLAHHGMEGQKWGVQNGPPYPLDKAGQLRLKKQKAERKYEKARARNVVASRINKVSAISTLGIGGAGLVALAGGVLTGPLGAITIAAMGVGAAATNTSGIIALGSRFVRDNNAIKIDRLSREIEREDKLDA